MKNKNLINAMWKRRWDFMKLERAELERFCADPDWCEEQIEYFFRAAFYQNFSCLEQFEKWGNPEETKKQFCLEFLDAGNPPQSASDQVAVTEHFLLVKEEKEGVEKLYFAPYFRNLEFYKNLYQYYFRDLTEFSLKPGQEKDMELIKKTIQAFGLVVRPRRL